MPRFGGGQHGDATPCTGRVMAGVASNENPFGGSGGDFEERSVIVVRQHDAQRGWSHEFLILENQQEGGDGRGRQLKSREAEHFGIFESDAAVVCQPESLSVHLGQQPAGRTVRGKVAGHDDIGVEDPRSHG